MENKLILLDGFNPNRTKGEIHLNKVEGSKYFAFRILDEELAQNVVKRYNEFESLQKENEELRKQLTWIPVEDYLPKDRNDVLVKVKQNEKVVYKMDWYNQEINAWHRYSCAIEGFVIEWLPIPDINNK